jgi:hypothetical protein
MKDIYMKYGEGRGNGRRQHATRDCEDGASQIIYSARALSQHRLHRGERVVRVHRGLIRLVGFVGLVGRA